MKANFRMLASLAGASAAFSISSASFAQQPPSAPAPPAAAPDQRADWMRERIEAQARALHDILNIRPDQEAAFQDLFATMNPHDGRDGMGMQDDVDDMARLTTPERLDRMAAHMADRQAQFQRHADAVRRFYAVLSPEQQRAFDALQGMMGEGPHGMADGPMGDRRDHGGDDD